MSLFNIKTHKANWCEINMIGNRYQFGKDLIFSVAGENNEDWLIVIEVNRCEVLNARVSKAEMSIHISKRDFFMLNELC